MNPFRFNVEDESEVVDIYLDKTRHPIAFQRKVDELIKSGLTKEQAELDVMKTPIQMEVCYSPDQGLFLVESEAIGCTPIYNPYGGEECIIPEDEE